MTAQDVKPATVRPNEADTPIISQAEFERRKAKQLEDLRKWEQEQKS